MYAIRSYYGIVSAYLGLKYQDKFSCIGAFSPAFMFIGEPFFEAIEKCNVEQPIRMYHDMGTEENDNFSNMYLEFQNRFDALMKQKLGSENVLKVVDKGARITSYNVCYTKLLRANIKSIFTACTKIHGILLSMPG